MLPVLQFSWWQINPISVDRLTGSELLRLASPQPAVVHDLWTRRSFVVDFEQAQSLVRAYPESAHLNVMDSAIGPSIALGLMAVPHDLPASFVATVAEWQRVGYVVVEDRDHRPIGLFSPSTCREVLADTGMVSDVGASDDVRQVIRESGLAEGLELVESLLAGGEFHSEQLNLVAPAAPWCSAGAGHWVAFCPCDYHPGASCRRRADIA